MSGGVDSSVAALTLLESGHEVEGVTLRLFDSCGGENSRSCCSLEDVETSRRTAEILGINHRILDLQGSFERMVIQPFVREYSTGRTPNPCIRCNDLIKFGLLLDYALERGFDALATGHYARIIEKGGRKRLARGVDEGKDQSYVLFSLLPERLERIVLPLGGLTKKEVRQRASVAGLPSADKRESQDICFVDKDGLATFLDEKVTEKREGRFKTPDGRTLGAHDGIHRYTVGQRRGLGVPAGKRLYVSSIDSRRGDITLVPREELGNKRFLVKDWLWHIPEKERPTQMNVQVRYHQRAKRAAVTGSDGGDLVLEWIDDRHCVTPGQAAVGYTENTVVGGGWISGSEQ